MNVNIVQYLLNYSFFLHFFKINTLSIKLGLKLLSYHLLNLIEFFKFKFVIDNFSIGFNCKNFLFVKILIFHGAGLFQNDLNSTISPFLK